MAFWGQTEDCDGWPIRGNFFDVINAIAHWIGEQLREEGVYVSQSKEKFGEPRVYVVLDTEEDRKAYRRVYMAAIRRWPMYAKYIIGGADFDECLGSVPP